MTHCNVKGARPLEVPNRGPPHCVTRAAATLVNYIYMYVLHKLQNTYKNLGIQFIVIFKRAAREPAHNDRGPLKKKIGHQFSRRFLLAGKIQTN
jgi:hypothetical protein